MKEYSTTNDSFYKAQNMAHWSFIGLLIPLLGVIFGAMSKSRIRLLEGTTDKEIQEISRIKRVAGWGFGISLTFLILQVLGLILLLAVLGTVTGQVTHS